jgi:hypothetical protein
MTLTWALEAYISSAWVDISSDVISDANIVARWGITGNTPLDRMASTGTMKFDLKNDDNRYSPDHASALAGWGKGISLKITFTFENETYIRFRGIVDTIDIDAGIYGSRRARVTSTDWMDYAAKYPLTLAKKEVDKTADQAITTIVNRLSVSPQEQTFDTGASTFPTVFDMVGSKTRASSEISKLINSEVGYCYLRKDKSNGENLVFESFYHRKGTDVLTEIPMTSSDCGLLQQETGDYLLQENNDNLILNNIQGLTLDNTMSLAEIEYARNVINYMKISAYPKNTSSDVETFYTLKRYQVIGSGETKKIKGKYRDPSGGGEITVDSSLMITPVAGTDYKVTANSDGTGTNLTSDCTLVADFGTESFKYTLTNGSSTKGYIVIAQARGYRVGSYDPIIYEEESTGSYSDYGYFPRSLEQPYQQDDVIGSIFAGRVVDFDKKPRTILKSVTFNTVSDDRLLAFLNLDIGDIICAKEDQSGIDGYYHINGVEFTLQPKGIIMCKWLLVQFFCLASGLSLIGAEFAGGAATDGINYGYIESVSGDDVANRSFSAWIYMDQNPEADSAQVYTIFAPFKDGAGNYIAVFYSSASSGNYLGIYTSRFSTLPGGWRAGYGTIPLTAWCNIVVTYPPTDVDAVPVVYIDGTPVSVIETLTPSGTLTSEVGAGLVIGNTKTSTIDYTRAFDGQIADARVYDRILSATEAAQIHTEGIGGTGVLDGLIFQGPVVRTKELSLYADLTLTSDYNVLDAMYGYVGRPSGSPISRILP